MTAIPSTMRANPSLVALACVLSFARGARRDGEVRVEVFLPQRSPRILEPIFAGWEVSLAAACRLHDAKCYLEAQREVSEGKWEPVRLVHASGKNALPISASRQAQRAGINTPGGKRYGQFLVDYPQILMVPGRFRFRVRVEAKLLVGGPYKPPLETRKIESVSSWAGPLEVIAHSGNQKILDARKADRKLWETYGVLLCATYSIGHYIAESNGLALRAEDREALEGMMSLGLSKGLQNQVQRVLAQDLIKRARIIGTSKARAATLLRTAQTHLERISSLGDCRTGGQEAIVELSRAFCRSMLGDAAGAGAILDSLQARFPNCMVLRTMDAKRIRHRARERRPESN